MNLIPSDHHIIARRLTDKSGNIQETRFPPTTKMGIVQSVGKYPPDYYYEGQIIVFSSYKTFYDDEGLGYIVNADDILAANI